MKYAISSDPERSVNLRDSLLQDLLNFPIASTASSTLTPVLLAKTISAAVAIHLLQRYGPVSFPDKRRTPVLPKVRLRRILDYIDSNISTDLDLPKIAKIAQMSPYYFAHLFTETTGLSPHQYVLRRRIEKAKQMLSDARLPLIEIALEVGFSNQSHFTTVFRKQVGTTPKEYRLAKKRNNSDD
jgi:AraC family transcriptional regulator